MANQISGNAIAVNARLRLRQIYPAQQLGLETSLRTYTDASGNYTFSNVGAGTYQIVADLNECSTSPYNSGYKYPSPVTVTMDAAGDNVSNVNLQPVLANATNTTIGVR